MTSITGGTSSWPPSKQENIDFGFSASRATADPEHPNAQTMKSYSGFKAVRGAS
jgi:hypothetical protein